MPIVQSDFRPAWWLRGAHAQTLYPHVFRQPQDVQWEPERLELPDGDFVDLQWAGPEDGPLVALFHGLEGSGESKYIRGLRPVLTQAGIRTVLMHFRGCSGVENRLLRGYHSGETGDMRFLLSTLSSRYPNRWIGAVGFSLGGNALLKYLGESGTDCPIQQAIAISVPFDLAQCSKRLASGASRLYTKFLLARLNTKVEARRALLIEHGIDVEAALNSRDFRDFDGAIVAPIFGFEDADDYYRQSSCGPFLSKIQVPSLILHATDDPFMTPQVIPSENDLSPAVTLELSRFGGHVGFVGGPGPGCATYWLDSRICQAITAVAE